MENIIKSDEELLKYCGWVVQLVRFSATHSKTIFQLTSHEGKRLYLNFVLCKHITAPIIWHLEKPQIREIDNGEMEFVDTEVKIIFSGECIFSEKCDS